MASTIRKSVWMSFAFGEPPSSGEIPFAEARDAKTSESTSAPARAAPITLRRLGTGKARAIITTRGGRQVARYLVANSATDRGSQITDHWISSRSVISPLQKV